jgi:hypothetical protein
MSKKSKYFSWNQKKTLMEKINVNVNFLKKTL